MQKRKLVYSLLAILILAIPSSTHAFARWGKIGILTDPFLQLYEYSSPGFLARENGEFMLAGGYLSGPTGADFTDEVFFLKPDSGTRELQIIRKAQLPVPMANFQIIELEGDVYIFGGSTGNISKSGTNMKAFKYEEKLNQFIVDSSNSWSWTGIIFQHDDKVKRVVWRKYQPRNSQEVNLQIQTYSPGVGWGEGIVLPASEKTADEGTAYFVSGDGLYYVVEGNKVAEEQKYELRRLDLITYLENPLGIEFQDQVDAAIVIDDHEVILKFQNKFTDNVEGGVVYDPTLNQVVPDVSTAFGLPGKISGKFVFGEYTLYEYSDSEDDDIWLTFLYGQNLGGQPDAAGYAYWRSLLKAGVPRLEVEQKFLQSNESETSKITSIYRDILHREPDPAGLAYWILRFTEGMTVDEITEHFLRSDEYKLIQSNLR